MGTWSNVGAKQQRAKRDMAAVAGINARCTAPSTAAPSPTPPTCVGPADGEEVARPRLLQRQQAHGAPKHGALADAEAAAVARGCRAGQAETAGQWRVIEVFGCTERGARNQCEQRFGGGTVKPSCEHSPRSWASRAAAASNDMPLSIVRSWRNVGSRVSGSTHSSCRQAQHSRHSRGR
jgi:hypothetical protein